MGDNMSILNEEDGVYGHTVKEVEETTEIEPIKIDWKRKLTSRKFWAAVCGFITLMMIACGKTEAEAKQVAAIVMAGAVVIGYIIGEGLTDVAGISAGTEYEVYDDEE